MSKKRIATKSLEEWDTCSCEYEGEQYRYCPSHGTETCAHVWRVTFNGYACFKCGVPTSRERAVKDQGEPVIG